MGRLDPERRGAGPLTSAPFSGPSSGPAPGASAGASEAEEIAAICARHGDDRLRMLDILRAVQDRFRWISPTAIEGVAAATGASRLAVRGVASFFSFLSLTPKGRVTIRLCDDIIDRFAGYDAVLEAFETTLGVRLGETSADGAFSLDATPCIGMCDQAPAAMVNDIVLTALTPARAREVAAALRDGARPEDLVAPDFAALSPHARALRMVRNNVRRAGEALLGPAPRDAGLARAAALAPNAIIAELVASGLRGCGGAGFPTGRKWGLAAAAESPERVVIANADEGEPGTFKDRVLLTERPHLLIEGMTIAARAIGAARGIIYLRGEYAYLRERIEEALAERRRDGLLGAAIMGIDGFDFDIRVQMGAGAYICGEESALIASCEGQVGEPRTRPPFVVAKGYLGLPTVVDNVETLCHAARILDRGAAWFFALGTADSHGTKLFSVAGDCAAPGVYELPYGFSVRELLAMAGGADAAAVLVGGPSGTMIGRDMFDRRLSFADLATGGAVVVFGPDRDMLEIVDYYMSFFVHESCGYCTPCRVGAVFLQQAVAKFRQGRADPADIGYLADLSHVISETSRCGLGRTAPNPVVSTLANFRGIWEDAAKPSPDRVRAGFDLAAATAEARRIAARPPAAANKERGA